MRYLQFAIYMYASAAKRYNAVILFFFLPETLEKVYHCDEALRSRREILWPSYPLFISVCVNYLTISLLNPTFFNSSLLESRHAH